MIHPSLFARLLDILPFRRRVLRLLEKIAVRYEPISRQVVFIETRLRHRDEYCSRGTTWS